jgi:hypothetical protein
MPLGSPKAVVEIVRQGKEQLQVWRWHIEVRFDEPSSLGDIGGQRALVAQQTAHGITHCPGVCHGDRLDARAGHRDSEVILRILADPWRSITTENAQSPQMIRAADPR